MKMNLSRACQIAFAGMLLLGSVQTTYAQIVVNGTAFQVQGLVGVGRMAASLRDEHGETFGSISGLVADTSSWTKSGNTYSGIFYASPDRGYNVAGTIDYTARINTIAMSFTPVATNLSGLNQNQIGLTLTKSTLLYETSSNGSTSPLSGIDPVPGGISTGGARPSMGSLPALPQGYNGKLSLDAEGIVKLSDGSTLISDEYGPSIYRFSKDGQFIGALPVANSVRPVRNGVNDFSSNNPTVGQPAPTPANPTFGRANNQGFEGLSLSPDGKTLFVALQSAARQDLANAATRDNTRLFTYDVSDVNQITLTGEYAVQLPKFQQGGSTLVAAQSEILALSESQLLILPRDSNGFQVGTQTSNLRRVDVIDISNATNILGESYESQIAPGGILNSAITPAQYTPFLDINNNAELARFGLVNGVVPGLNNLSEKWEGMALLPTLDPNRPNDYFLFIANDNDFATTDGFQVGASYNDGKDIDTMFLAYRVTISTVPEAESYALLILGLGIISFAVRRKNQNQ